MTTRTRKEASKISQLNNNLHTPAHRPAAAAGVHSLSMNNVIMNYFMDDWK